MIDLMERLIYYAFILTALSACSILKNVAPGITSLDPDIIIRNTQIYRRGDKEPVGTVKRFDFDTSQKAKSYLMERRLLILKKFEVLREPYFGTDNAKYCSDNLKSDYLVISPSSASALLQLPVRGENKIIYDCLSENNSHWANIHFLSCGSTAYDIRLYFEISSRPLYQIGFACL
jgi:hypothetical protein